MTLSNKQVLSLANKINKAQASKEKHTQENASFKNLFMHDYMQKFYSNDVEGLKFYHANIAKDKPMNKQKAIVSQAKTAIRVIASQQSYEIASLPNRILIPSDITDNEKPIAIYSQLVKVAKNLKLDSSSVKQKQKLENEKEKFIRDAILEQNPHADTIQELKDLNEQAYSQAYDLASLQWDEIQKENKENEFHDNLQGKVNATLQSLAEIKDASPETYADIIEALNKDFQETKAA